MRKPDKIKWRKAMEELLVEMGATPGHRLYTWTLPTPEGTAGVTLYDNADERRFGPWLACCFDSIEEARKTLGTHVFVGKHNLHIPKDADGSDAIVAASAHLREIRFGNWRTQAK